jgi:hypothetical protein
MHYFLWGCLVVAGIVALAVLGGEFIYRLI